MNDNIEESIESILRTFHNERYSFYLFDNIFKDIKSVRTRESLHPFSDVLEILDVKFLISIGGDGTFLRASHLVGKTDIPIIGVNLGRMGFLTDISVNEIEQFAHIVDCGSYFIEERPYIEVIMHGFAPTTGTIALNEVCISKRESTHLMTIHAWIDDEYLGSFWADGIIIASPTGSTAYSLSLGGPIISPSSKNLILNFIAPHSLTVRPLVIPDSSVVKLKIEGRDSFFNISIDSNTHVFSHEQTIIVKRSTSSLRLLKIEGKKYFTTLKNKLMWGVDIRN